MALAQCSPWNISPPVATKNSRSQISCSCWGQTQGIFGKRYAEQTTLLKAKSVAQSRVRGDSRLRVVSQANDILRVLTTVVKTARDGLEFGSNLVPDSVPKPVARVIVAVAGVLALLFLFNSLVSIATFILGIGGLAYIAYIYFNRDSDSSPSSGGGAGGGAGGGESPDKSLEEARRIMEKYK